MTPHLEKRHGFPPVHLCLVFNKLTGAITQRQTADLLVTPTQTNRHQTVRTTTVSIPLKTLNAFPTSAVTHEKGVTPSIPHAPKTITCCDPLRGRRTALPQRWAWETEEPAKSWQVRSAEQQASLRFQGSSDHPSALNQGAPSTLSTEVPVPAASGI